MGGLIVLGNQMGNPSAKLRDESAGAKKEGLPTTLADLGAKTPAPGENAATDYGLADALYRKAFPKGDSPAALQAVVEGAASAAQIAQAKAELASMSPVFQALAKGAARPACLFPDLDEEAWVRPFVAMAGRWLPASVALASSPQEALEKTSLANRFTSHLFAQPSSFLIKQGLALERSTRDALVALARKDSTDGAALSQLSIALDSLPNPPSGRPLFAVQIVEQVQKLSLACACKGPIGPDNRQFEALCSMSKQSGEALAQGLEARFLHGAREAWGAMPKTAEDLSAVEDALTIPLRKANEDVSTFSTIYYDPYLKLVDVWQSMIADQRLFRVDRARDRVARAFLWALSERARTRVLPKSLKSGDPSMIDPYSGQPLIYQLAGKGFRVYSVGPTGRGGSPGEDSIALSYP